ncbi:TetR/AcrR family transcriptional regulator [Streptomyces sp. NPDC049585]|uniref:TetR/AcrR family transcriptional regulator n=1 Tax=Streptomyces sp. NPDC049585 TaxID=3155154 RepID=UPI003439C573
MQANNRTTEQERTFTEAARRAQIVGAAIEVIADLGYGKATFARIAERAGLSSTGMISYHFKGKDDLMREVVAEVLRVVGAYMVPRIEAESTARGRLRAHIEANIAALAEYPKHLPAVVEVLTNTRMPDFDASMDAFLHDIADRLRAAQAAGEFGEFDPWVMALAIRSAIDAVVSRAATDPGLDLALIGRELADLFDRATRK